VPGANLSISLSIVNGNTFFSRNASVRKMIVVSEMIEHTSNGHMKTPPLTKNPIIEWKGSDIRNGQLANMVKVISSSKPSGGNVLATSSGMGGSWISKTDRRHTFAKASLELF